MSSEKIGKFTIKQVGPESDRVLRFIGTDETSDRDGDILTASGWDFTNYLKNPVFLPFHDYGRIPPGKCVALNQSPGTTGTSFDIKFASIAELCPDNQDNPSHEAKFAETLYQAYRNGYMNAVSVGFNPAESEERTDQMDRPSWERGRIYTKKELLELSAVSVPSNPNALIQARSAKSMKPEQIKMMEIIFGGAMEKGAIPFKKFPLAAEDAGWDAGAVVKKADTEDLKIICTWYDSSKDTADLTKGDFKLPHHMGSADGHKTVWKGVAAAMGALLGARGGVSIPESDKEACYNHLKKHYTEFEKDAPDFKAYTAAELKSMFEEETDMDEKAVQKAIEAAVTPLLDQIKTLQTTQKAGAKYSADTVAKMQEAHDHIDKGMACLKAMISDSGTVGNTGDGVEKPMPNTEPDADDKGIDLTKVDLKRYGLGA